MRKVNMGKVEAALSSMVQLNGSTVRFELKEGVYFDITATDINRSPVNLTDGISQDRNLIRVMADDWHTVAGADRPPEKGDKITVAGVRYAVDTVRPAQFQNTIVGYVITLRG